MFDPDYNGGVDTDRCKTDNKEVDISAGEALYTSSGDFADDTE